MVGAVSSPGRRLALGLGGEQRLRIGMLRVGEHVGHRPRLDDLAALHDDHVVGDAAHDIEVVGDEQHRHADLRLQVLEQLQDLRLHGDVERRRRLVGDEQVRPVGERHRDHHPLTLAAGKLMRIGAEALAGIGDADFGEQLDDAGPGRRGAALCSAMISPICFSIGCSGFSEVIGSWNTMVTAAPRMSRSSPSDIVSTSRPRKRISPVG